ncbi:GNAT family N-acetyltransferase [Sporolactobacillus sp. THM7-7]|nr:GNAT family N-acetyltransferase [Sporolactobacillus sp. THM7-7]
MRMIAIRKVTSQDAEAFLRLIFDLQRESEHILCQPGGPSGSEKKITDWLKRSESHPRMVIFAAEACGRLIGFAAVSGHEEKPIRHRAQMIIGVLKEWQRQGYGRALLDAAETWAKKQDIHRLELTVGATNRPAMLLYGLAGYRVEGTRKASITLNGKRVNEFYMAKLLQRPT